MDISKYVDYFHDGYVNNVSHIGRNISFSLESAVIQSTDKITEKIYLSKSNTLKGNLNIYNIKTFKIGNKIFSGIFQMEYDDGDILDLEIKENSVFLLIEWKNFPPKVRTTNISKIEIEAEKIEWSPKD